MESKLIIIRGNSGSGKTTAAKNLQQQLGQGTLLVSQDVVRREMLNVQDKEGNLSIELIRQIAEFGKDQCEFVIVEGIMYKKWYGDMLDHLIQFFNQRAYTYYFDLSFEETVLRHNNSPKKMEFGEDSLRSWWSPNDFLGTDGETTLSSHQTEKEIIDLMLKQLETKKT